MNYKERIRRAAATTTYLRLWRNWANNTEDKTTKENFVTWEASEDVISSCHFSVLIIMIFAQRYGDLPVPWERLGSDVCEIFFSSLGSFNLNKRTYTALDALQTTRTKMVTEYLWSTTGQPYMGCFVCTLEYYYV